MDEQQGLASCTVHPSVAASFGLASGQRARLGSPLGTLDVQVRVSRAIHPGACVVHRGGWAACDRGVNLLVEGRHTDLGQGTAFYGQRVWLAPIPG